MIETVPEGAPWPPRGAPHVVIIVADDLGYGDLSCMGSDFATPHLDRLAASGIRFTDWYSTSPVCSPSRASLLSGLYPERTGITEILSSQRGTVHGFRPGITTLADALRDLGYRTGMVGKWHLGTAPDSWPDKHGFDDWFGFLAGCVDYYSHLYYYDNRTDPIHDLWENGREIFRNGSYLTELFTEEAVRRIRDWTAAADAPFFLYLAYNAPHYPMHAPAKYVDRFRHLPADRRITAAMVSALDDGVGAVLDELARRGILDNTIVFFMSDNGPSPESRNWLDGQQVPWEGGSTAGLRGQKFTLFEGGVRVPAMLSWPSAIAAGQVVSTPLIALDVFPTVLRAAGGAAGNYRLDGSDLTDMLLGRLDTLERPMLWAFRKSRAVRDGRWKLVIDEDGEPWLSDLDTDREEMINVAADQPAVLAHLCALLNAWEGHCTL
jgi:arylsulfatase A-like enzyme